MKHRVTFTTRRYIPGDSDVSPEVTLYIRVGVGVHISNGARIWGYCDSGLSFFSVIRRK
jgi:hypothetical protein